jgi:dTDP-4-dehydrorhamnose reductase
VLGLTRVQLDLTDLPAVSRRFAEDRPQLVIHCAALSKSPECQADPAGAWKINMEATRALADLSAAIPLIFFSTDLIFDGQKGRYVETDSPHPLSVYADTKLAAEEIVLRNPNHSVVRTSLNGGTSPRGDRGFNEEMRRAWQAGKTLKLFIDEFRCPIPAAVTARAVWELAARGAPGLYHLAGAERLSRWQIGQLLAARWPELNPKIRKGSLREYEGPPRSPDTSLDCGKIQKLLSFPLPGLTDWLAANPSETF